MCKNLDFSEIENQELLSLLKQDPQIPPYFKEIIKRILLSMMADMEARKEFLDNYQK